MNTTQQFHDLGQSTWLDNITRALLNSGGLRRYIDEFSVTGLTSNPTIFDHAIGNTDAYDDSIHDKAKAGQRGEGLFVELALEDLRRALTCSGPSTTPPMESMAGSRWSCRRCWPTTRHTALMRRPGFTGRPTGATCSSRFRYAGRCSGDRGIDLRWRAHQCDAAVFARAVCRRRRSLPAWHRTPSRCWAQSAGRVGRLAVRQPLGQGGERHGAGGPA